MNVSLHMICGVLQLLAIFDSQGVHQVKLARVTNPADIELCLSQYSTLTKEQRAQLEEGYILAAGLDVRMLRKLEWFDTHVLWPVFA